MRTFSCLLLLLGCMDKQQPPAPREPEPALNPLQSRKEHYGLCVRVLASHTASPLGFYGMKNTALTTAAQLHFSWRTHSHWTSFRHSSEWKWKGARSGPLEVLLSWAARVPEKHIYLFITLQARIQRAWLAVSTWGMWGGACLMVGKVCVQPAVLQARGERWGVCCLTMWMYGMERDGKQSFMEEGDGWRRHVRSRVIPKPDPGSPYSHPSTLSLFQPIPPQAAFPCSTGLQQEWMLVGNGSAGRQGRAGSAAVQLTFLCRYIGHKGFKWATSCDQCSTACSCLKSLMFSGKPGTGWCGLSAMEPSGRRDSPPYFLDKSHTTRQPRMRACFRGMGWEVLCF